MIYLTYAQQRDASITQSGRMGFLTHRNNDARFFKLNLIRFST